MTAARADVERQDELTHTCFSYIVLPMLKQDELGKTIIGRAFDRVEDYLDTRPVQKAAAIGAYVLATGAAGLVIGTAVAENSWVQEQVSTVLDWADEQFSPGNQAPDLQPGGSELEGPYTFNRDFPRYTGSITLNPNNFLAD
jgi:hypothetical protein